MSKKSLSKLTRGRLQGALLALPLALLLLLGLQALLLTGASKGHLALQPQSQQGLLQLTSGQQVPLQHQQLLGQPLELDLQGLLDSQQLRQSGGQVHTVSRSLQPLDQKLLVTLALRDGKYTLLPLRR